MWPPPEKEFDSPPDDRSREVTVRIPCENGGITLRVRKSAVLPLEIDIGSRWKIAYTLELDGMTRTETLGYASTYDDAVSAIRSYLSAVRSERAARDRLDALDVKSRLDSLSPSQSNPVITGEKEHGVDDAERFTPPQP